MNESAEAFLVGLFTGFFVTGLLMLIFTVEPLRKYDTGSVFTWKETK
jgi:hypothetical protein